MAILVAAVLGLSLFPAAAGAQSGSDPCAGVPAANEYVDRSDARDVHEASIDCVIFYGIAVGSTNAQGQQIYQPLNPVTRGQMASFIAQTLDAAGYDLPEPAEGQDEFDDIDGSVHARNINRLALAEIVSGTDENSYSPNGLVTRQQMASFMVQAAEWARNGELTSDADFPFLDVSASNVHRNNINKGEDNGLFRGVTATTFRPGLNVLRDQMATFLVNLFRFIYNPETAPARVVLSDASVAPGEPVTGEIRGNARSATVGGCGIAAGTAVNDTDATAAGIQFRITIPTSQTADCQLAFTVTNNQNEVEDPINVNVDVVPPAQPSGQTSRPELISAELLETVTQTEALNDTTKTAGTVVRYCFDDEARGGAINANLFYVYTFANSNTPFDAGDTVLARNTSDPTPDNCVRIRFNTVDTTAERDSLTVATVDLNAVRDFEQEVNPYGDARIGSGQTTNLQAGTTDAPDLRTVTNCAASPGSRALTHSRCTFNFDETAFTVDSGGFHIITIGGVDIQGSALGGTAGGQPGAGEQGGTAIVVEFANNAQTGTIEDADIARGYVELATVSDSRDDIGDAATTCTEGNPNGCAGNANPLESSDTPDRGSDDPDLLSATFDFSDNTEDIVIYEFDVIVSTTFNNAAFCTYNNAGDETCGTGTAVRGSNTRQVVVTYPNGQLATATGASVRDGAVTAAAGEPNAGAGNEEDEVGVSNPNPIQTTSGLTTGPDLVRVVAESVTTATETVGRATYHFDEDLLNGSAINGEFFLVTPQGQLLVSNNCSTRTVAQGFTEEDDDEVRCRDFFVADQTTGAATATPASADTVAAAVLGAVDDDAVTSETGGETNPEGAAPAE